MIFSPSVAARPFIPPGSTIGVLGGGQLARMTALAARPLGYRVHLFDPDPRAPAAPVCEKVWRAEFTDHEALGEFGRSVDVATLEFENIPAAALQAVEKHAPVRPHWSVLHVSQHREREKCWLRDHGFPCAPFEVVESPAELVAALPKVGGRGVLKTAEFGYDGKGQRKIEAGEDAAAAWADWAGTPWSPEAPSRRGVLEGWIDFAAELSVVCARSPHGETAAFPVTENEHEEHILSRSLAPGRFSPEILRAATALALAVTEEMQVEGLLGVEMFLTHDGEILVNELAPRPHNSGHLTMDACVTGQFEQHVRAVCGLPLGATTLLSPAVMVNLLGQLWPAPETAPDWRPVLREPGAKLHLYGKAKARRGRKMGHVNVLAPTLEAAMSKAEAIRRKLTRGES